MFCRHGHSLLLVGVNAEGRCNECCRERARQARAADPEKFRARDAARRQRRTEQAKRRRHADPEKARAQERERYRRYRKGNPREQAALRARYERLRAEAHAAYGGECKRCGRTEDLALHHVNGDGKAHRRVAGGGVNFFRWLKANGWPSDPPLALLCPDCHRAADALLRTLRASVLLRLREIGEIEARPTSDGWEVSVSLEDFSGGSIAVAATFGAALADAVELLC